MEVVTPWCSLRPPVLGPALPPGFRRAAHENDDDDGEEGEDIPGPALPPGYQAEPSSSEGEDEDLIGPMPSGGPVQDSVALDFERRARRMKEKLTGDVSPSLFLLLFCAFLKLSTSASWICSLVYICVNRTPLRCSPEKRGWPSSHQNCSTLAWGLELSRRSQVRKTRIALCGQIHQQTGSARSG